MARIRYTALPQGRAIRVLKLAHGKDRSTLRGEILHIDLDDDPEYAGLSYVWGTETDPVRIECNGCQIEVTQNFAEALWHIRDESISIYLWVDALCINQHDLAEKSHQGYINEGYMPLPMRCLYGLVQARRRLPLRCLRISD